MLHKTRGIVLRFTKYGDTSIIVNIFTEMFGLQTYIVNGVRSKTAKNKIALYQPLTLLDLVVYHRENAEILRIKEVRCLHAYQTLHLDVRKSAIAMFLIEVINKSVKDQSHAEEIYEFLFQAFITLDQISSPENFHLIFLLKLSKYLGFGPANNNEVLGPWMVEPREEAALAALLSAGFASPINITQAERRNLLDVLIRFYGSHIESLGELKSVHVLKEMFN